MKEDARPVIAWPIEVYDRTAAVRFPPKRKWYRFNYERASEEDLQAVVALVQAGRDEDTSPLPPAAGVAIVAFELAGAEDTGSEILQYRHLFDYVPDEKSLSEAGIEAGAFFTVGPPPDTYFEDENERPITLVQIKDEEAKRQLGDEAISIVMGHPESVLRCGAAEPLRPDLWTQADARLMARMFGVQAQLIQSRWLGTRCFVYPAAKDACQARLPIHEDCMAVVLPFRQLYSKDSADDLFNRCCKIHSRHCPSSHPSCSWVEYYKKAFNKFLGEPASIPLVKTTLTAQRYLDAFAYGAGIVHATSKSSDPETDLNSLLATQPKPMVLMGYHYILRELLRYVSLAVPVLQQNVMHWVNDLGWPRSQMPGGRELFGG